MRKLALLALVCVLAWPAHAQSNITASGTTCATSGACAFSNPISQLQASATIQLSGTFSATLQFEGTNAVAPFDPANNSSWASLIATPIAGGAGVTSATGTGTWSASVASLTAIRVRASAYASGTVVVTILLSQNGATGGGSSGSPQNALGTAGPNPQFANDTIYLSSGTIYARNNQTGVIDTSGADMRVVWDSLVAAYPSGGHFYFKNGVYPCNSLDQESTGGFSNFYCIGIPGGGSSQYFQWILEGESGLVLIDQFDSTPPQTAGAIINLTATAVSSVAAHSKIMNFWVRPDTVNSVGPQVFLKNIGGRVPTNQRGCETISDMGNALSVDYDNVSVDTNIAETSLAFPVEDGSCASYGLSGDTGGLIGLATTNSVKQENWLRRSFCMGCDVGLDIRSEHTILEHSYAVRGNHGIDYGVRGGTITHSSVWIAAGCGETAKCLTLGANMGIGSALTVFGFDIEDACPSGGGCSTAFVPVYHMIETNPGNTNGLISYSDTLQGTGVQGIANIFDGGGGASFSVLQATSQHNIARLPAADTFTRANAGSLGPGWLIPTGLGGLKIVSNTAQIITTGVAQGTGIFVGAQYNNDQFSKLTVSALDTNANSFAEVLTNASTSAVTWYGYYCSNSATTGSGIFKNVAGVSTTFVSQTSAAGCAAGDTIELRRITAGANVLLYAYHNGVLDKNLSPNPFTVTSAIISGGQPGIDLNEDAAGLVSATNFQGGGLPTIHGTDSLWSTDEYATTYNTVGNCNPGSSVSPAACGAAASGTVVVPTTTTTYTVSTTAVTQNSRIIIHPITDATGLTGSPTCVAPPTPFIGYESARTAGASFTFTLPSTTGASCWTYQIMN